MFRSLTENRRWAPLESWVTQNPGHRVCGRNTGGSLRCVFRLALGHVSSGIYPYSNEGRGKYQVDVIGSVFPSVKSDTPHLVTRWTLADAHEVALW